jgi:multidrug efflux pump subunit AcrB
MSGGIVAVIVIVVIVVLAALAVTAVSARRRRLQQQFGPEYDRVVTEQSSRLRAEAELTDRQRRVRKLDIRPLSEEASELVTTVMTERGYPIEDDEQVMADLSVEHAQTVSHFRAAQQITTSAATGDAATEDLRQALIHYRALFTDLLGDPDAVPGTPANAYDAANADVANVDVPNTEAGNADAAEAEASNADAADADFADAEVSDADVTPVPVPDPDGRIAEPAVRDQADISQR